jgi:hypothetical protein
VVLDGAYRRYINKALLRTAFPLALQSGRKTRR